MSVLQRFEKRLEGLVEGAFARAFKAVVQPVEIASAMQKEAESHASILGPGRTLVPNRYVIDLSPEDHDNLAQYAAPLAQELAQTQAEFIGEQGWMVYGDVLVEIERGEGLRTGMFRIFAEVFTGGMEPEKPQNEAPPQWQSGGDAQFPGSATTPVPGIAPPAGGFEGSAVTSQPVAPVQPVAGSRTARLITADGRQFAVAFGSTIIGRGEGAQIRLADVGISRQHARIDFDGSSVVLTDLGSTNGTTVNGNRVNAVSLQHGDVVQLGTTTLTFRLDG